MKLFRQLAPFWYKKLKENNLEAEDVFIDREKLVLNLTNSGTCVMGEIHRWDRDYALSHLENKKYCHDCDQFGYRFCGILELVKRGQDVEGKKKYLIELVEKHIKDKHPELIEK